MSGLVITGYASLDHVVVLSGDIVHGRTTTISDRPANAWPRLGGGPAFVAAAARRSYHGPVVPVSWVGSDELGKTYIEQLAQRHISSSGMVRLPGARSPVSMLIYNPGGDCACLYDPGIKGEIALTEHQQQLLAAASWICVTIGPKEVTEEVLKIVREDQKLAWIVKNDPNALTSDQAARLASRADVIFCNGRERAFLAEVKSDRKARNPGQWLIETQVSGARSSNSTESRPRACRTDQRARSDGCRRQLRRWRSGRTPQWRERSACPRPAWSRGRPRIAHRTQDRRRKRTGLTP